MTRSVIIALATAASALAPPLHARELPAIDALGASGPAAGRNALVEGRLRANALAGHAEERLGVPTFVRAAPGARRAAPVPGDAEQRARQALHDIAGVYRASAADVAALRRIDAQALPNGAAIVRFENRVDGIEVFREQIGVLLDRDGALSAAGGYFVGGGAPQGAAFVLGESDALAVALRDFAFAPAAIAGAVSALGAQGDYSLLGVATPSDDGATLAAPARVKRVWFRLPEGLEAAYYVEIQVADSAAVPADYYAYVVSAKTGKMLFRHRQTEDATYTVYADTTAPFRPADGAVVDYNPHPTGTPDGSRPAFAAPSVVTLDFGAISTQDRWLAPNATQTSGNNADAYADLNAPDGYSNGDLRATATSANTFNRTYVHTVSPVATPDQSMAAVTQLFYVVNWLHDEFYDAGFNEASFNAQNANFGRGGLGNDAIRAEGQDNYAGGSRNNANMSTPADGSPPRMQMYAFTGRSTTTLTFTPGPALTGLPGTAAFGPQEFNLTAQVVAATDGVGSTFDACTAINNVITGRIALVDRGSCTFVVKAQNVQAAGAVGLIIANNAAGANGPGLGGTDPSITIPALSMSQSDGAALRSALAVGPVTGTMFRDTEEDRDGTMDSLIIAHEWGHYISNRLVGNSSGLTTTQARGMGEGWGDFHSLLTSVRPGDNVNGGTYSGSTYAADGPFVNGAFYGLRRYPYTTDLAKNPLTFRHIENGVALPPSPPPSGGGENAQVHNTGEVWASMLWECYENLLTDRGHPFDVAYDRMKRYLVGGYKLTPNAPTFVEARDGILAVAFATDPADHLACAQGFAKRGLGIGASVPDRFNADNAGIVESFTLGADVQVASVTLGDAPQYCDADGTLDSGETGTLTVVVRNVGAQALGATTISVATATSGVTFPDGASAALPATSPFGQATVSLRVALAGVAAPASVSFDVTVADGPASLNETTQASFLVHADDVPASSATDDAESAIFAWSTRLVGTTDNSFRWSRREYGPFEHTLFGPDSGSDGETYLESPPLAVAASGSFGFTLSHRYSFEADSVLWDGGVIEVSTDGGTTWTDIGAAAAGYTGTITNTSGNPFGGRMAYTASSTGYPAYTQQSIDLGTAYQGQTVRVRFGIGTDAGVGAPGWDIATVAFTGITNTPFPTRVSDRASCAQLQASEGSPQATQVGTAFPTRLVARLLDGNAAPRAGQGVTFAAPATGASGTFAGAGTTVIVVTDAQGYAIAPVFSANATTGSYTVTASNGPTTTSYTLTNQATLGGSAPDLLAASDSGASSSDDVTNAATPSFTGTCVTGDVVQLVEAAANVGNPVVCASNAYTASAALSEGAHAIAATFRRGNTTSAPSATLPVTIDRTAPAAPTISAATPSGPTHAISGTGEAGATVTVSEGATTVCSTTVSGGGTFGCTGTLATGSRQLTAAQVDAAGNAGPASGVFTVVVGDVLFGNGFEG